MPPPSPPRSGSPPQSNAAAEVNTGAAFASVEPLPASDQSLVPSALAARTCTSYSVFSMSDAIVAFVSVIVVFVTSVHDPVGVFTRYW